MEFYMWGFCCFVILHLFNTSVSGNPDSQKFTSDGTDFVINCQCYHHTQNNKDTELKASCGLPCPYLQGVPSPRNYTVILEQEKRHPSNLARAWSASQNWLKGKDKHGLSDEEAQAVYVYTLEKRNNVYSHFNEQTKSIGPNRPGYYYNAFFYFLYYAVSKLSAQFSTPEIVYRGVSYQVNARKGEHLYFNCFTSTSLSVTVAEQYATVAVLQILRTQQGVKIEEFSAFPLQREVLIPPCEDFEVVRVEENVKNIYWSEYYKRDILIKRITLQPKTYSGYGNRCRSTSSAVPLVNDLILKIIVAIFFSIFF